MSKYVIIHGQFHEIPDDELMHWKYIKRQKVNGKWVYTYDTGKEEKRKAGEAASAQQQAGKKLARERERFQYVKGKIDSGEYFDKDKGNHTILEPYRQSYNKAKQEYVQARKNAEKANAEYQKTPQYKLDQLSNKIKDVGDKIDKRRAEREQKREEKRAEKKQDWEESKQRVANPNNTVAVAKEYLKDRFGYDEKEQFRKAEEAKSKADKSEEMTWDWMMDALGDYGTLSRGNASKESIESARESLRVADEEHTKDLVRQMEAGVDYVIAKTKYMETPLAKLEKLRDEAATGLEDMAKRIRGKRK